MGVLPVSARRQRIDPDPTLIGRLNFRAHVEHAYTPRETGGYGGRDHIVLDEDVVRSGGRFRRQAGDAVCKVRSKFWGLHPVEEGRAPSCKRCVEMAKQWANAPEVAP